MAEEGNLQRKAMEWLRRQPSSELLNIHGGAYQESGHPDTLWVYKGHAVFIEYKSKRGKVHPLQAHRMSRWRQAGATAFVARTIEGVKEKARRVMEQVDSAKTSRGVVVSEDEIERLTPTQRQILAELAGGAKPQDIAPRVGVALSTLYKVKSSPAGRAYFNRLLDEIEQRRIEAIALAPLETMRMRHTKNPNHSDT